MPPKVVFDTNIFISAIIFGGNPRLLLELARKKAIRLYTSKTLLFELAQKLKLKFDWSNEEISDVITGIIRFVEIVTPHQQIHAIKDDPSDNRVLEVAAHVDANYIISGDKKHILPLVKFRNAIILTAQEFLKEKI